MGREIESNLVAVELDWLGRNKVLNQLLTEELQFS